MSGCQRTIAGMLARALLLVASSGLAAAQDDAAAEAMAAKLRDRRLILLHAAEFDPLAALPELPAELRFAAGAAADPDVRIVQFAARIGREERAALTELGATPLDYVPNDAFLVRASAAAFDALARSPRVRAVVPFEPAYRLDPDLLALAAQQPDATLDVMIELFDGSDTAAATLALLEAGALLDDPDAGLLERLLARVPAARLTGLAHVRDVQWIQAQKVAVLRALPSAPSIAPRSAAAPAPAPLPNETTTWVIQSDTSGSTPVWNNGVLGDGVIIGHIDDPIDLDSCFFEDPAVSAPGPTHRKVVSHHGSYSNPGSHGTHTAGTSAGDQQPINGVIDDNGIAYRSRLAHTNLSLITGSNLKSKLEELHGEGATVFTNSWGDDFTTKYDSWCVDIDELMWEHQETLVCFAVTNGSTLKNPENAKNVLAVGATEQSPRQKNHCSGGRGPTADGRRKPEIYSPGCGIVSARDNGACGTLSMSGTSMASPSIAAAGALVKDYFESGYWPGGLANPQDAFVPSGSLLKAVLINSARDMTGVSGYPSNTEGWGRLLLDHSLFFAGDKRKLWLVDPGVAGGLANAGDEHSYWINVYDLASELNLCLVFPDAPGAVNSSSPVVNDLDLEVLAPDGSLYRGNVFSGGLSATGGSGDPLNNVERIRLKPPVLGWYFVTVRADNVASAQAQSYALVASGNLDPPADGGLAVYGAGTPGTGGFVPSALLSGSPQVGDDVTLTIGDGLGGSLALLVMGFARDATPFAGGQLLVATPWITFTLPLDGAPGTGGDGDVAVTETIPDDPTLTGLVLDFQALVVDPAATKKLALTNGAELTIGS